MSKPILTTAERFRRFQRDKEAYRRRSLYRRSHARFYRDLKIRPNIFLAAGVTFAAQLREPYEEVRTALRGRVAWTLDTAMRLVSGHGFLVTRDLTCFLDLETLGWADQEGLIAPPQPARLSLEPLLQRPSLLIGRVPDEPPAFVELASGDRVVTLEQLERDLMGSLGWRPDLLNRIEAFYRL